MHQKHMIKGALCMTAGFFFLALFGAFLKAATTGASIAWTMFIAYSFACLILLIFISREPQGFLKTKRMGEHLGRVIFGAFATFLYAMSLNEIPLLNATLLLNTAPLFVPFLALFFLNTKASLKTWIFLIIGFIGITLILHPQLSSFSKFGNLVGLSSGIIQALAYIFVKRLTSTEPIKRINFYFFFLSALFLAPYVLASWETPPLQIWIWALSAGLASFISQFLVVKGYHLADASHMGPFQYASVVFSGLFGWLVWTEIPRMHELIGALLVILGGVLAIFFAPKPTSPPAE